MTHASLSRRIGARTLADCVATFGEVTCLRMPGAPDSPMLNRIVGLGSSGPPTEETLDEAIAFMGEVTFYVSLEPQAP